MPDPFLIFEVSTWKKRIVPLINVPVGPHSVKSLTTDTTWSGLRLGGDTGAVAHKRGE
jgi:hypothetical protein